jgi:urease accessory protein
MPLDAHAIDASHQRARGELRLAWKRRGDATVLDTLRQDGCLKARFPRTEPPDWPGAITLNSAGGVAGGDRLTTTITAGPGTSATIASQAAERIYRALPGAVSEVATTLHVASGASLEWLPQETILFDRCALRRRLDIHLAPDAWFLGVESLVFGRTASDEQVHEAHIHDCIALRRDGRLVLHDAVRLDGEVAPLLGRAAIGAGARAAATIIHAAPGAARRLDDLRAALAPFDAGASALDDLLIARIVAPTGAALRGAVAAGLNILRGGRTLPRVWLC